MSTKCHVLFEWPLTTLLVFMKTVIVKKIVFRIRPVLVLWFLMNFNAKKCFLNRTYLSSVADLSLSTCHLHILLLLCVAFSEQLLCFANCFSSSRCKSLACQEGLGK